MSGKSSRIAYVEGLGVESVEPVGRTLTGRERDFVFGTAAPSDCYIWDLEKAPGERRTVDGAQFSGLTDPSPRGSTSGEIGLIRDADGEECGRPFAAPRIEGGDLAIKSSDAPTPRATWPTSGPRAER